MDIHFQHLCRYLGVQSAESYGKYMFNFVRNHQTVLFYIPMVNRISVAPLSISTCCCQCSGFIILLICRKNHCCLDLHFLDNVMRHLFIYLFAISISSLWHTHKDFCGCFGWLHIKNKDVS